MGIDYDFFTPVDVPEGLTEKMEVKKEIDEGKQIILVLAFAHGSVCMDLKKTKESFYLFQIMLYTYFKFH